MAPKGVSLDTQVENPYYDSFGTVPQLGTSALKLGRPGFGSELQPCIETALCPRLLICEMALNVLEGLVRNTSVL